MTDFLKCKMCGGDLRVISGLNICECEHCGTRQSIPRTPDERKTSYFNRANEARRANEFDKAIGIYESIVAEFPDEAEAYWGLCLCKYGIEYVDDPKTGKKIPTCHRTVFDSIFEDKDYQSAISCGDMDQVRIFKQEAGVIDRIQKSIIKSVNLEKPYDVFICYKETDERTGQRTTESVIGQELYENLCSRGYRTFFARVSLEDVLGQEYEPHIFAALNSARTMVVLGSSIDNFYAPWVRNEWSRYLELVRKDKDHSIIPCFIDMDPYDLPSEFSNLQAQDLGKVGAIQDIVRGIEKILGNIPKVNRSKETTIMNSSPDVLLDRGEIAIRNREWSKAQGFFEELLNIDPRDADVYTYLLLIENKCRSLEELLDLADPIDKSANFKNAVEFADVELKNKLRELSGLINKKSERKRKIRIAVISAIILAGLIIAGFAYYEKHNYEKYNEAIGFINQGDYVMAMEKFQALGRFKDSKEQLNEAKYQYAIANNSEELLEELGEYKDASERLEQLKAYKKMIELYNSGEYEDALKYFNQVPNKWVSSICSEIIHISAAREGDCVEFGKYFQNDNNDEKEPIEWYVIKKDDDKALLLSKNILEYSNGHNGNLERTFEKAYNCLNDKFYPKAFTKQERKYISTITREIPVENTTECHAFIPSKEEIEGLSEQILISSATDYAVKKGVWIYHDKEENKRGLWIFSGSVSKDEVGGSTGSLCDYVSNLGNLNQTRRKELGIRPAIWVGYKTNINEILKK